LKTAGEEDEVGLMVLVKGWLKSSYSGAQSPWQRQQLARTLTAPTQTVQWQPWHQGRRARVDVVGRWRGRRTTEDASAERATGRVAVAGRHAVGQADRQRDGRVREDSRVNMRGPNRRRSDGRRYELRESNGSRANGRRGPVSCLQYWPNFVCKRLAWPKLASDRS
jgi:hypothetical protein